MSSGERGESARRRSGLRGGWLGRGGGGFVDHIPAAAGGGEENVFEGRVGAADGAQAETRIAGDGAQERFAELVVACGREADGAEAVGIGRTGFRDGEGGLDGGEEGWQVVEFAGQFEFVERLAEDGAAQLGGAPWATTRPALMMSTRSQVTSISGRMWLEMMTVM